MRITKHYFKFMDTFFPSIAARQVYHAMSNPRIRKFKEFELQALAKAQKEKIQFKDFEIQTYCWGERTDKVVFLVHGWEGHAGNFGAIIDTLLQKGFYIVAFDGPSHGNSSIGSTNMFDFADLVSTLLKKYRPTSIISHSFGSVTSVVAISRNLDIPIEQWVLVTTPHAFEDRLQDVAGYLGVTHRTMNKVGKLIESETNYTVDVLNMDSFGAKVSNVQDALIIHSKADKILPIESARRANKAIPQSQLIELDDLGHYGILWSENLKEILANRLN